MAAQNQVGKGLAVETRQGVGLSRRVHSNRRTTTRSSICFVCKLVHLGVTRGNYSIFLLGRIVEHVKNISRNDSQLIQGLFAPDQRIFLIQGQLELSATNRSCAGENISNVPDVGFIVKPLRAHGLSNPTTLKLLSLRPVSLGPPISTLRFQPERLQSGREKDAL